MKSKASKILSLVLIITLVLVTTPSVAYASEYALYTNKTHELKTQMNQFGNSESGYYADGTTTKSKIKVKVSDGAFCIYAEDEATNFTITIKDSKKNIVKTLKSSQAPMEIVHKKVFTVNAGVDVKKGTYTLEFESTGEENLNGFCSLVVLKNKSTTVSIDGMTDIAVKKGKEYSFKFKIEAGGKYIISGRVDPYDLSKGKRRVYLPFTITDSKGKKIASRKEGQDDQIEVQFSRGTYTMKVKPTESGLFVLFAGSSLKYKK